MNRRRSSLARTFLLLVLLETTSALWTPCNYPVPSDSTFRDRCSTNYLRFAFICDVDREASITAVEKIDSIVSRREIFVKHVRVGVAVLRNVEFPDWSKIRLPDLAQDRKASQKNIRSSSPKVDPKSLVQSSIGDGGFGKARRHDPNAELIQSGAAIANPDWYCVSRARLDSYSNVDSNLNSTIIRDYVSAFSDSLRQRWFYDDCSNDLFFLAVTDSVLDQASGQRLLRPLVQISYGQELRRLLPTGYDETLQNELNTLSKRGLTALPIIVLALERLGEQLPPRRFVQEKIPSVFVDQNGQHRIVKAVVVQHAIPPWAIYTFIGCLGSVCFALILEWSVVRRKSLTLRGASSGGGSTERQRTSKSDNVQVHLYF